MKHYLNTIEEVRALANADYFKGKEFDNYLKLKEAAEQHFKDVTENLKSQDFENIEDVKIDKVKIEYYFVEQLNKIVTVEFYEAYLIDSGMKDQDYFYGFIIKY